MNWLSVHAPHVALICLYLAILARHAWIGKQHVRSLDDYLVAGRRMGGMVIALSFYATFMSTNTFIGAAGKSWSEGLAWCTGGVVLTTLAVVSWFVVAPRFVPLTRQYQSLTVADFLGTHYESIRVRQVAALIVAFSSVFYLVAIYRGASLALQSFLDLPYVWCLFVVLVIVTAYTLAGGFESVVLTDALQGSLMLAGALAMMFGVIRAGGGIPAIMESLQSQDAKLVSFTDGDAVSLAMAYSLAVGVKFVVEPRQLSRFYGLKDQRALRLASFVAPLVILVTYLCLLPIGAMARAVVPLDAIAETDQVVPYLLSKTDLLGPIPGVFFLLVLLSAAMSSIDSVLLVCASTIDRDLVLPRHSPEIERVAAVKSVQRTRIWVVVVSAAAAAIALSPYTRDIVRMTAFSGSLYGACFLPTLAVGLFVRRRSPRAALATMVVGAASVVTVFLLGRFGVTKLHEVYPGIVAGLLTFAILTARRSG